jgi:hypothetical protein
VGKKKQGAYRQDLCLSLQKVNQDHCRNPEESKEAGGICQNDIHERFSTLTRATNS